MRSKLVLVLMVPLSMLFILGMAPGSPGSCPYGQYFPFSGDAGVIPYRDAGVGQHPGFNCPLLGFNYKGYVVDLTTAPPSMTVLSPQPNGNVRYNGNVIMFGSMAVGIESQQKVWIREEYLNTGTYKLVLRPLISANMPRDLNGRFMSVVVSHNLAAPEMSMPVFAMGVPQAAVASDQKPLGDGTYVYRVIGKDGNLATFIFQGCN